MPHFQRDQDEIQGLNSGNDTLEKIHDLLVPLSEFARMALAERAATFESEAKPIKPIRVEPTFEPAPKPSSDLFASDDKPLDDKAEAARQRNENMSSESAREAESQATNVFHRDVGEKKD